MGKPHLVPYLCLLSFMHISDGKVDCELQSDNAVHHANKWQQWTARAHPKKNLNDDENLQKNLGRDA